VYFENKIENFIAENQLLNRQNAVLVAVSGGIDSAALLHFFVKSGYKCAVAHCNFHLRGENSNRDACFVKQLAKKYAIPFYIHEFNTFATAEKEGISIEMAARKLRYDWFEELLQNNDFQAIIAAHHQNDNAETILLNLIRGTGIRGLTGMRAKRGNIVRPFLCVTRLEIENYAKENGLQWCEDLSNSDTIFKRNHIRYSILPEIEKQNPVFVQSMAKFSSNIFDAIALYNSALEYFSQKIFTENNDFVSLDIQTLLNCPAPKTILFEILQHFDFQSDMINEIFDNINSQSGKKYFSKKFQILKNREKLIVSKIQNIENKQFIIEKNIKLIENPLKISFEIIDKKDVKLLKVEKNIALFDYERIKFPLVLRTWQSGDYFQPFGVLGKQKVSDFFVNQRLSLLEKQNVWLLLSDKKVIWIVNHRADGRFKITEKTEKILKITFHI
jgi:tRNA(Ile)-lysidine synthase